MQSNSIDPCPSSPSQPIPTSTPTPISNSDQNPSVSIDTNAAESQPSSTSTSFVVPTLSSADWARSQQIVTSDSSNPSSQPLVMATPDPPMKKRGRPRKPPPLTSQKPTKKKKINQSSQPPESDTPIESTQEFQNDTHTERDDDPDKSKAKRCWFTPESDGKSDIDLVAEWCSHFENFNAWRTQQKNVVRERVAAYLVSKGHADRGGRECEKKISALIQWFHHANALRKGTGEGNKEIDVEFNISKEELAEFKWNKRRVSKKVEEEEGSLQVRILRRCPWYEELEPVFRDRPSANPLATRDSVGHEGQRSTPLSNPNDSQSPTGSSLPYTGEDTPPADPLEDELPLSQEHAPPCAPQGSQTNRPSRPVTPSPSNPPSKRLQNNSRDFSTGSKESPQNTLDLFAAMNRLPTKQDLEESESRALKTQEQISSNFSKDMCKMMTTNRATELATRESIAVSKMNVEIRIARSKMVVDLIRGNMDPTAAEALALRSLPDVQPSHTQSHCADAELD
ncbi:hypothetical protein DFH28DRAFT_927665 [Melampsora americana]|nr:hypothetical protein DFH28DRAFT_927665 [Melampsora americana]